MPDPHAPEPHRVRVGVHADHRVGRVDDRVFSGFLEHLGRAVYGGVFDPGSPHADGQGYRTDVVEALRSLRPAMVRYPGGNFVSAHRWRDGIGPPEARPRRPEFAWRSIETNRFGLHEFMDLCDRLGSEPMLALNLGTAGPADAAELLEYANLPPGTAVADERVANGRREPWGVRVWCLGNEMDGPWQAGHVPAATYAERARVAAALMKGLDPTIETVVCGSSSRWLPTWLEWDRIVLEHCWDEVDYVATHRYSGNRHDDTRSFLAEGVVIDEHLEGYRGLLGFLRARRRSPNRVHVAFDEWNVWYRETNPDGGWREAPPLLEEVYTLEDALVCAQYLHAFIRHADLVRIACLAQLVNVIAPLLVRPEGVLTQTIAWPFRMLRTAGGAEALRPVVAAPEMPTRRGDVPVGDAVAVRGDDGRVLVSIVQRDPDREAEVRVALEGFGPLRLDRARVLTGHPRDANTWETPGRVAPRPLEVEVTPGPGGRAGLQLRLPGPAHAVAELVPAGLRSGGR